MQGQVDDKMGIAIRHEEEVFAYDHDCPGGHRGCEPVDYMKTVAWIRTADHSEITDPGEIADLERRLAVQQENCHASG